MDERSVVVCRQVCEECAQGLPSVPLSVEPQVALPASLEQEKEVDLRSKVAELRKAVGAVHLEGAVASEAAAHMDDLTLGRFVIARDGKVNDAKRMFVETMQFRVERSVSAIRAELHPAAAHAVGSASGVRHAAVRAHFYAGWGGCCKDGTPFFIEQL